MADDTVAAAFLEAQGEKPRRGKVSDRKGLGNALNTRQPLKRARRPRQVSDRQALDNAFWAGVKDGMIHVLKKLDPDGPCCELCGKRGSHQTLDLDHIRPKGKGGVSRAHNGMLLCRDCHQEKHRNLPEWSTS